MEIIDSEDGEGGPFLRLPDLSEAVSHPFGVVAIVDLSRLTTRGGDDADRNATSRQFRQRPAHGDGFVIGMSVEREQSGHGRRLYRSPSAAKYPPRGESVGGRRGVCPPGFVRRRPERRVAAASGPLDDDHGDACDDHGPRHHDFHDPGTG